MQVGRLVQRWRALASQRAVTSRQAARRRRCGTFFPSTLHALRTALRADTPRRRELGHPPRKPPRCSARRGGEQKIGCLSKSSHAVKTDDPCCQTVLKAIDFALLAGSPPGAPLEEGFLRAIVLRCRPRCAGQRAARRSTLGAPGMRRSRSNFRRAVLPPCTPARAHVTSNPSIGPAWPDIVGVREGWRHTEPFFVKDATARWRHRRHSRRFWTSIHRAPPLFSPLLVSFLCRAGAPLTGSHLLAALVTLGFLSSRPRPQALAPVTNQLWCRCARHVEVSRC